MPAAVKVPRSSRMYYQLYELNHAALQPLRAYADAVRVISQSPLNPFAATPMGRSVAAAAEVFERTTRRYAKPAFGIESVTVDGKSVAIREKTVWTRPFCSLLNFERDLPAARAARDPKLLIVAPMSGHYATLLRGTVRSMAEHADVYITDWADARMVPASDGRFDLDNYVDYIIDMLHHLGPNTHVMAVCQPSVPVLAAVAVMEARGDKFAPASMTLMGGPIDTRRNPTAVNKLAEEKGIDWFRENVIMQVPWPNPGAGRDVYPGFLQLTGFMSMNLDRHLIAHKDFFMHLVKNDGDSAEKHREFYDEYLAVMDLTAEFYLQTVDTVFVRHDLPKGQMMHRGEKVDLTAVRNVALFTVEGENDDISGLGQTQAAHDLCINIPQEMRAHYVQPQVGHYGVFNGSRFRSQIVPRIVDFMAAQTQGATSTTSTSRKRPAKGS
jgi:poly(3-hydroxybutyrate) depolymerase